MALRARISTRAANQIRAVAEWWQQNRPSAPSAVSNDIREAILLLAEQPYIGSKYSGSRVKDIRRLYLPRLGYFLYYKAEGEYLNVLAFWNAKREHQPRM